MAELDARDRWSTSPRLPRLWAGVLVAPFAWAVHLSSVYAMSSMVCSAPWTVLFYVMTAAALAVALGGGWIARGAWREAQAEREGSKSAARAHFMALNGMLLSGLLSLAILAQTIPMLVMEPCRY